MPIFRNSCRAGLGSLVLLLLCKVMAPNDTEAIILLNEVLYDPSGSDQGSEFVELINTESGYVGLAGMELQFANGAVGEVWTSRWHGSAADSIVGHGLFLIVDRGWSSGALPDAETGLALQNGPDALRLLRPDGTSDVLGYGALSWPGLFEQWPHPGVSAGHSLSRYPDGHDTGNNRQDWREADIPTPGGLNYKTHDLGLRKWFAEPPCLIVPGTSIFRIELQNTGLDAIGPTEARFMVDGSARGLACPVPRLAPEDVRELEFDIPFPETGKRDLQLSIPLKVSPGEEIVLELGRFMVGAPELVLSEIMAAPESRSCEWVEILVQGDEPVRLSDYLIADADGVGRSLPDIGLGPSEHWVIVQDKSQFLDWLYRLVEAGDPLSCGFVDYPQRIIECTGSWPNLNNSPPDSRDYADRLTLLDAETGLVLDAVKLGADGLDLLPGRSLERVHTQQPWGDISLYWGLSTAQAGSTPGCPNSLTPRQKLQNGLQAFPNPFCSIAAGGSGTSFTFRLAAPESGWLLQIFEPWGRCLRILKGDDLGPGPRAVHWDGILDDGNTAGRGALIARLTISGAGGGTLRQEKILIASLSGTECR